MAYYDSDLAIEKEKNNPQPVLQKEILAFKNNPEGTVLKATMIPKTEKYYDFKNGYGAYECVLVQEKPTTNILKFVCSGNFVKQLDLGQTYIVEGEIIQYKEDKQLQITEIKKIIPETKESIISFLRSLDGVDFMAEIIYDKFGKDCLETICKSPDKIQELSPVLYKEQILNWKHQIENLDKEYNCLVKLTNLGISIPNSKELFEKYGKEVFSKIKENPYFLAKEIEGYSFIKCDSIAKSSGFDLEGNTRLCEGIMALMSKIKLSGSTRIHLRRFYNIAQEFLNVSLNHNEMKALQEKIQKKGENKIKCGNKNIHVNEEELLECIRNYNKTYKTAEKNKYKYKLITIKKESIKNALKILILENRITVKDKFVYESAIYNQEKNIACSLLNIEREKIQIPESKYKPLIDEYLEKNNIQLEQSQYEAVSKVVSCFGGVFVIDGSAGCGKTFCTKIAISILRTLYKEEYECFEPILIAPTGKAAKVAQKASNLFAQTIHKALGYKQHSGFFFGASNKMPYDCVILDEASMLDTNLTSHLFSALYPKTKIILLGDTKQLPSIGSGNVLNDIIHSKKIETITLTTVKRQAENSGIIRNAQRIINKEFIHTEKRGDSIVYNIPNSTNVLKKLEYIASEISKDLDLDEFQILCSQHAGLLGTNYLNYKLQSILNTSTSRSIVLNKTFHLYKNASNKECSLYFKKGDKVMNIKNNYNAKWYEKKDDEFILKDNANIVTNGETGIIHSIKENREKKESWSKRIIVKYDDGYVFYDDDFSFLEHAYAITIHKSQGSEWKVVVLVLSNIAKKMADNSLFYTGFTRSKQMQFTIADKSSLEACTTNLSVSKRQTGLKDCIEETFEKGI